MSAAIRILGLSLVVAAAGLASPAFAADDSTQAKTCASSADSKSLTGDAKTAFVQKCMQSPMVPPKSDLPKAATKPAKTITAPSGSSTASRSAQCSREADKQGLKDNARKAFRMSCLAGAGPVANTGSSTQPPAPSKAKPDLGVVKNGQQN